MARMVNGKTRGNGSVQDVSNDSECMSKMSESGVQNGRCYHVFPGFPVLQDYEKAFVSRECREGIVQNALNVQSSEHRDQ